MLLLSSSLWWHIWSHFLPSDSFPDSDNLPDGWPPNWAMKSSFPSFDITFLLVVAGPGNPDESTIAETLGRSSFFQAFGNWLRWTKGPEWKDLLENWFWGSSDTSSTGVTRGGSIGNPEATSSCCELNFSLLLLELAWLCLLWNIKMIHMTTKYNEWQIQKHFPKRCLLWFMNSFTLN